MTDQKPPMTAQELAEFTAREQAKAWEEVIRRKKQAEAAKAQAAKVAPLEEFSGEIVDMAEAIRGNLSNPMRVGDILNHLETAHNGAERTKQLESKGSGMSALWPSKRPEGFPKPYVPVPFDRAAARRKLVGRFPWLEPTHPENPDQVWHSKSAARMLEDRAKLESGDFTPDEYKSR